MPEELSDNSFIQVPDSSPLKQQPSSPMSNNSTFNRLPSLRDKFTYREDQQPQPYQQGIFTPEVKKNLDILRKKFPGKEIKIIYAVLKQCNMSLRDASAKLSMLPDTKPLINPIVSSSSPSKENDTVASSKVEIKKPKQTIFDRYFQRKAEAVALNEEQATKKRRLVRGARSDSTQASGSTPALMSDDEDQRVMQEETDDSEAEDVDNSAFDQAAFDERILKFLNTAEKRDIVDIAGITPSSAEIFIKERPFKDLLVIENSGFGEPVPAASKRNIRKKPLGEKILERTSDKLRGYDAVDSLIKQCSNYGKTISHEIQKWGVGVHGEDGELEFVEIDVNTDTEQNTPVLREKSEEIKKEENPEQTIQQPDKNLSEEDIDSEDEVKAPSRNITHERNPMHYFQQKPSLLAEDAEVKNYQQVGVNWLNLLYQNNLSCILADEMGLGKTFQVIAFLAHLKEKAYPGPHLIVVPSSTLENWLREFQKFCPSLVVQPYYGSQASREELRYQLEDSSAYDVLVTTYNLATGNKYDQHFLKSRRFNVIVYDEGHMLKNSTSDRYVKLMKLSANFRLLLTGTPLQNNLKELISLLAFILPGLFKEKREDLKILFDQKAKTTTNEDGENNYNPLLSQQAISNAKTMMTPFVLRRKKDQVLQHLPQKRHFTEFCTMVQPRQEKIYRKEIEDAKKAKLEREATGKTTANASKNLIMQLRKAALHPLLFRDLYNDAKVKQMASRIMKEPQYHEANKDYIIEDMQFMSDFELNNLCEKFPDSIGSFQLSNEEFLESGKVKKLKELMDDIIYKKSERMLVFSLFTQVLDILERVLSMFKIKFLRLDGKTSVDVRQDIIDQFYNDDSIPVFLLSTRAGGFGINLVCANNVVIFDQSFNPHDDKQAEDRAHRVGQTKEVNVYRLIMTDTIEENILTLAQNKLQLDSSMSDDKEVKQLEESASKMVEAMIFKE